ncbi:carbonic anhydrase-related protein 10-like [Brevipalpus obovatus]|uniref:carbonic anhydrase-related protein 10-like n=1 Tax=Brevipalpus obovatus TaxID=246614 RepID=UPI003D9EA53B
MDAKFLSLCLILTLLEDIACISGDWDEWWTYDGISGPDFWGLLNPEWSLCNKGKRQSPIDVSPDDLLYDQFLRPLNIDTHKITGTLENNGHSIVFKPINQRKRTSDSSRLANEVIKNTGHLNISGGPLSYSYHFDSLHIHFGRTDNYGSEHYIGGTAFPAEIQLIGFNSDLYRNITEASRRSYGLVGIAILVQIGEASNEELKHLITQIHNIKFRGQNISIDSVSIRNFIPDPESYMTYEGSMSVPACFETVTWIVMNKPIFISRQQLYSLRRLMQGTSDVPKAPLGNNFRPTSKVNHRVIRTNIDFRRKKGEECPTLKRNMNYQVNSRHLRSSK